MSSQFKMYRKRWQSMDVSHRRGLLIRGIASLIVFILGCGIIFNMRAKLIGEDGATFAMYFMGILFIQALNMGIFYNKLIRPESFAIKMCIAAVILTSLWVNVEEKIIMPMMTTNCDTDCTIIYDRAIPFSDAQVIYDRGRWQVID